MFVKLTRSDGSQLAIAAHNIALIEPSNRGGSLSAITPAFTGDIIYVRESPSEALALLAGEREGKAEGRQEIEAVVAQFGKQLDALWNITDDHVVVKYSGLRELHRRLVAYFDGRA